MKNPLLAVTALLLAACSSMPSWVPGGGWTTLIDGDKGLENFNRLGSANWRAEGGAIVADKAKASSYLVSKESYKDFVIRAEFWADKNTNSAIFIRAQNPKRVGAATAYEVNIKPVHKAAGKWNTYEITAKGGDITVVFNGTKTAEMKKAKYAEGPFALQFSNHGKAPGGAIKWRKVQVKPL